MATPSAKQQFLDAYDREHAITMRLLRAYPTDKLELRPHPKIRTARELAWVFVQERGLGTRLYHDEFANRVPSGSPSPPPQRWDDLLSALEKDHNDFRDTVQLTDSAPTADRWNFAAVEIVGALTPAVNHPPSITNPGSQTTVAGTAASLAIVATDPDGDPLTFSASGLPSGLAIAAGTGVISGTVASSVAGTYGR